ncbi:MAG TPA: subclass B1 metallo-beta-lactamase, partial [Flavobacterium sp.]|nr:subclass B1 metallo-beta-lactamase [Flavobacterium sp.]
AGNPFPANGMYLITNEGAVLIDTPWDKTQFQPLLDSIEKRHHKKAVLCISTHYHDDRTIGLEYYRSKGIRTYSSALTKKLCRKYHFKQAEFTFKNDTVFNIGGYKIETFYPGKGHTKDNIVVWFAKDKTLYGGCFLKSTESTTLGNLNDADVKAWPASIKKVIAKFPKPDYTIPGHQDWKDNKSIIHTQKLLSQKK